MMRCIGSKGSHLRKVFGSEGLTMALAGGLIGVPLGLLTGHFLNYMIYELIGLDMALVFPIKFVLIAISMTIVLTVLIIQPPLFRAARFRPGDALRYQ